MLDVMLHLYGAILFIGTASLVFVCLLALERVLG
jgi:hypothetical protein